MGLGVYGVFGQGIFRLRMRFITVYFLISFLSHLLHTQDDVLAESQTFHVARIFDTWRRELLVCTYHATRSATPETVPHEMRNCQHALVI